MCILVSARLHATAAPDAPEPMIRTSTFSCIECPHVWPCTLATPAPRARRPRPSQAHVFPAESRLLAPVRHELFDLQFGKFIGLQKLMDFQARQLDREGGFVDGEGASYSADLQSGIDE